MRRGQGQGPDPFTLSSLVSGFALNSDQFVAQFEPADESTGERVFAGRRAGALSGMVTLTGWLGGQ